MLTEPPYFISEMPIDLPSLSHHPDADCTSPLLISGDGGHQGHLALSAVAMGDQAGRSWDEVPPAVRERAQSVVDASGGYIRMIHFDAGVRHWLVQLSTLFGEVRAWTCVSRL